jgi:hypothetical protein
MYNKQHCRPAASVVRVVVVAGKRKMDGILTSQQRIMADSQVRAGVVVSYSVG